MRFRFWGIFLFTVALLAQTGGRRLFEYESDWFVLRGISDPSKRIKFQVEGITTGTTREITVPDANFTLVGTTLQQTLTNKTLDAAVLILPQLQSYTVSSKPSASAAGRVIVVTDGANGNDCTTGGGSNAVICRDTGSAWIPLSGGAQGPQGPAGTRNLVVLSSDVTNDNATANTLQDVTGLSFSVTSGTLYRFYISIPYTSAATTTGSRWTINGPSTTLLRYTSRYTLTATSQTVNFCASYNCPGSSNASSTTNANLAILEGLIQPSANGTIQVRFASEIASSAIVAQTGATLEWW